MTLTPAMAAQIASAVYGIRQISNVAEGVGSTKDKQLLDNSAFDFGKATSIGGTSGAGLRSASGFSMVVPCRSSMQGEYLVATRGTVTGYDWLTDFAAAMERWSPAPEAAPYMLASTVCPARCC